MHHEENAYLDEIICPCSGTRRAQILTVLNRGEHSLDAVSRATGACSGCGGCEYDVEQMIQQQLRIIKDADVLEVSGRIEEEGATDHAP